MTLRVLLRLAAGLVLIAGVLLAVLVIQPKSCGMDEFECAPNAIRVAVALGSALAAVVLMLLSVPDYGEQSEHRQE